MKTKGTIAVMCALSLSLVACGGGAQSATSAEATSAASAVESTSAADDSAASATSAADTASAASATSAADATSAASATSATATSIVGSWKMAAFEFQGILITGDLQQFGSIMGDDEMTEILAMTASFAEDGTGSLKASSEELNLTWAEKGDGYALTIETVDGDKQETTATLENGALKLVMDEMGNLIFTPDGSYASTAGFDAATAKPITSEDSLVGSWTLAGMQMGGLTMTGDAESMAEMFSYDEPKIVLEAGGKADFFGDEVTYTVDANGAKVGDESLGIEVPILGSDGYLYIDMSGVIGTTTYMVMAK